MLRNDTALFKQITEISAKTDFSGYTIQYPPLFCFKPINPDLVKRSWKELRKKGDFTKFGIYIHIPFCKSKCSFCRYFSLELENHGMIDDYLACLKNEIGIWGPFFRHINVKTLYIGGGTPSILRVNQLKIFFETIYKKFDCSKLTQVCFEGNPDYLDNKKIRLLKNFGVNRLTIGVQTLDNKVIKAVNRYQTQGAFSRCFHAARKMGIENINVDLMVGLPFQTAKSAAKTLKSVLLLRPDMIHIHPFYPTEFSNFVKEGNIISKSSINRREKMILMSRRLIKKAGYTGIKFDAYGKSEKARNIQLSDAIESNSPFLGLGPGAVSHIPGYLRYVNTADFNDYTEHLKNNILPALAGSRVNNHDEMIYFVTSWLRYGKIDKLVFMKKFNRKMENVFPEAIKILIKKRKMEEKENCFYSKMKNIGEYLIYSKYFYDKKLIEDCKRMFGTASRFEKIGTNEIKYMLL